jgi:4-amino-4-deoxy-L-arabinose transferase-like glycosyltransferase
VLPLFLLEWAGIAVDWQVANWVNLGLWLVAAVVFYQILCQWMPSRTAVLGTLPLLLILATSTEPDYLDYNSESVCVPMLVLGLWGVLRLENARAGWLGSLGLGTLLGLLPYAKIQTVPMGLLLGAAAIYLLVRQKQYWPLGTLLLGSMLPTALWLGTYARLETVTAFWNDYFWNYYYYSFTTVYSDVSVQSRFGVRYVGRLFLQHRYDRVFWLVSGLWLLLGLGTYLIRRRHAASGVSGFVVVVCSLFLAANAYAAIQAGNLYAHYTLFVLPALLLLLALFNAYIPRRWQQIGVPIFVGLISLEGLNNLRLFTPARPIPDLERIDAPVRQWVAQQVRPGQKMTIWGYADRHFVWARLPAGNRLSHTFWAYWPSPLLTYRQQELIRDLDANQTEWLLDVASMAYSDLDPRTALADTPGLAGYVAAHYQLVGVVQGVRLYRRRSGQ